MAKDNKKSPGASYSKRTVTQTVQKGTRYQPTAMGGGLGMAPYNNPDAPKKFGTGRNTSTADRNTLYGSPGAKPPKPRAKPAMPAAPKAVKAKAGPKATVLTAATGKGNTGPNKANPVGPRPMAVNPRTGSTLGFTTGKTTGSTATKSGIANKTPMSAFGHTQRNAYDKGGVAGPTKNAAGKNASSMTGKRK